VQAQVPVDFEVANHFTSTRPFLARWALATGRSTVYIRVSVRRGAGRLVPANREVEGKATIAAWTKAALTT
jgi:hypothetical protein